MLKVNLKNEIVKRKYFKWLKEAEGNCDSTINNVEKAILNYECFIDHNDFDTFNPDKAIEFKKWLRKKEHKGKVLSLTTYHCYLRNLRKFFTWLCNQPGYKSKIKPEYVRYLNISEKEERIASQYIARRFPSLEEVIQVVNSIEINSEIDQRDRALISFTLLSGMRDKAIITLPAGCFDQETLIITQNPKQGVQTKFSKFISSIVFKFDDTLVQYVIEWANFLKIKNFELLDPLFPRNKVKQEGNNLCFDISDSVEPFFWKDTGSMRQIFKKRFEAAGLSYFPPHTFRHLAISLALKNCKNGEQIKAVSQNFGHENIATTFCSYANNDPEKLSNILKGIDFSGKSSEIENLKIEKIREILDS